MSLAAVPVLSARTEGGPREGLRARCRGARPARARPLLCGVHPRGADRLPARAGRDLRARAGARPSDAPQPGRFVRSRGWRHSPGSSSSSSRSRSSPLRSRPDGLSAAPLTFGLFALAAVPVVVKGLGYYSGVGDFRSTLAAVRWFGVDSMLLAYAAGWLVIPGALVALATPRGTVERAFAGFTVSSPLALFLEAALYATNTDRAPGGRFQERYLFTLIPLIVIAFGCLAVARRSRRGGDRGARRRPRRGLRALPALGLDRRPRPPGLAAS